MSKIKIQQESGLGFLWFVGWLFTIGFLQLSFGRGLLAILVWPYYIGAYFNASGF